jgi:hypothetical protein
MKFFDEGEIKKGDFPPRRKDAKIKSKIFRDGFDPYTLRLCVFAGEDIEG